MQRGNLGIIGLNMKEVSSGQNDDVNMAYDNNKRKTTRRSSVLLDCIC